MYMILKSFIYIRIRFGISEILGFVNWIIHPSFENQFLLLLDQNVCTQFST